MEASSCLRGDVMWRLHIWTGHLGQSNIWKVSEVAPAELGGSQHRQGRQTGLCQGKAVKEAVPGKNTQLGSS